MNLTLLQTSPGLDLYYDPGFAWLYAEWHGEQTVGSVRLGCEWVLQHLQQQQCHKLLNDNSLATGDWSEAAEWLGRTFLVQAQARGLQYVACVCAPDVRSRYSTLLALELFEQFTPWAVAFDDVATAYAWLQRCEVFPALPAGAADLDLAGECQ